MYSSRLSRGSGLRSALGERPSRRKEIVDAAMEMTDRLVHTQYDFVRHVVKSAGETLSGQDNGK